MLLGLGLSRCSVRRLSTVGLLTDDGRFETPHTQNKNSFVWNERALATPKTQQNQQHRPTDRSNTVLDLIHIHPLTPHTTHPNTTHDTAGPRPLFVSEPQPPHTLPHTTQARGSQQQASRQPQGAHQREGKIPRAGKSDQVHAANEAGADTMAAAAPAASTPATPVPDAGRYALTEKDQANVHNTRFTAGADFQGPVKVGGCGCWGLFGGSGKLDRSIDRRIPTTPLPALHHHIPLQALSLNPQTPLTHPFHSNPPHKTPKIHSGVPARTRSSSSCFSAPGPPCAGSGGRPCWGATSR